MVDAGAGCPEGLLWGCKALPVVNKVTTTEPSTVMIATKIAWPKFHRATFSSVPIVGFFMINPRLASNSEATCIDQPRCALPKSVILTESIILPQRNPETQSVSKRDWQR